MKRSNRRGFTLLELAAVLAIGAVMVVVIVREVRKAANSNPITVDSFRVAGLALCEKLHGGNPTVYATCITQVQAEWSRAMSTRSGFNTSAVPSIPAGSWP